MPLILDKVDYFFLFISIQRLMLIGLVILALVEITRGHRMFLRLTKAITNLEINIRNR